MPSAWPASYSDLGVVGSFDATLLQLEGEEYSLPRFRCVAHGGYYADYIDYAGDVSYYQHYQHYRPYLHFGSLC